MFCSGPPSSLANLSRAACGGEAYASGEMIDHTALLREYYAPFSRMSPGIVGMEDCESHFTPLKNRKMITGKYLVRDFLSTKQFIEEGELDNAYWLPGTENPADGLTKIKSEMGPILALLETGRFPPGLLRPRKGPASRE